jgi:hypothetical protein
MSQIRIAAVTAVAVNALLAIGCGPAPVNRPEVPEEIRAPETEQVELELFASGTQIYRCAAKADASGFEWVLKAPDATLFDGPDGSAPKAGTHFAGPTWEANDGSKFVGDSAIAKKATPDATAIPWLLIPKKSTEGSGRFSGFSFVQRVNTTGGKAPATGCDASAVNTENAVAYTASYFFYRAR